MGQLMKSNRKKLILLMHNLPPSYAAAVLYTDVQWKSVSLFFQFLFSLWQIVRKYHIQLFTYKTRMQRCWK